MNSYVNFLVTSSQEIERFLCVFGAEHGAAEQLLTKSIFIMSQARPLLTRALEEDDFDSIIDPRLQNDYDPNEMARMVACAAASTRHSAKRRPRMSQVNVVIFQVSPC